MPFFEHYLHPPSSSSILLISSPFLSTCLYHPWEISPQQHQSLRKNDHERPRKPWPSSRNRRGAKLIPCRPNVEPEIKGDLPGTPKNMGPPLMVSGTHTIPISDMGFFWEAGVFLTTSTAHNQIKWLVFF